MQVANPNRAQFTRCASYAIPYTTPETSDPPVITALLPLFCEKADTPAMIKHGMDVLRQSITFLNPGYFIRLYLTE